MTRFIRRLLAVLSTMGPAPAGGGAAATDRGARDEGVGETRDGDHGIFGDDADEPGEGDADEEEAQEGARGESEEEAGEEESDEDDDAGEETDEDDDGAGDGTDADASAEDEDEEEAGEEDEDADEDDDYEPSDGAVALKESWNARLQSAAKGRGDERPRIDLSKVSLREEAKKRFADLRDADENGAKDPEAMFEIALDATLQVLGLYHDGVAKPRAEKVDQSIRNATVGRSLATFRRKMGERLTPAVEQRMADLYKGFASEHGWREADSVPLKDLFRMAGGSFKKPAGKPGKGAAKPGDKAERQKRGALGAASGPKALGRTRPDGDAGRPKVDKVLQETHRDNRGRAPFFSFS